MIEIKGIKFEVNITRKNIRNSYLRVKGNVINATCPLHVYDYQVYQFIESKRDWIYNAYIRSTCKINNSLIYMGGDIFYIFGVEYKLVRSIGKKKICINNDTIFFTYKDDSLDGIKALYKYLDNRLLIKAQEYLDKYRNLLLDYGYDNIPEINARCMSSKWGACYTRKNKICISSYLIHYSLDCLEYIMVHEMSHFIVPNHSKRFYEIVSSVMPNYKSIVKKLNG